MSNVINYAESWQGEILEILNQNTITSPFIAKAESVKWTGAKTLHFTQNSVSGFKAHSRDGGWNKGSLAQADKDYTIEHDRDISFLVDRIDVDESNGTASIDNISETFTRTQEAPEVDARFFEKVYKVAKENNLTEELDSSSVDKTNVVTKFKNLMLNGKLRRYRANGTLIAYVDSDIMNKIELSTETKMKVELTTITDSGVGIETRVTNIDGVYIMEVIDDERFHSSFDYSDGFVAATDSKKLTIVFASTQVVKTVPKTNAIYIKRAGEHTEGDGDWYANRSMWDTFVFPNGKDGKVEGIYVVTEKPKTTSPAK